MTMVRRSRPCFSIASFRRSGYLRLSLNRGVDGDDFLPQFMAAFVVQEDIGRARANAVVMAAGWGKRSGSVQIGFATARFQVGHLIHKPSGTLRRSAGSVCWILGNSFQARLMVYLCLDIQCQAEWRSRDYQETGRQLEGRRTPSKNPAMRR